MTRRCKDCLIKTGNKKVKELAETLSYAHTAFLIVQKEKILLEQKLEQIKAICQTYDKNGVYYNLTEDIMKVIEGEGEC